MKVIAVFAGALAGIGCWGVRTLVAPNEGDFIHARYIAKALLDGTDPYGHETNPNWVPYPLPAGLFALPTVPLPGTVAAGVFFGLSTAALAAGIARGGQLWPLAGILISWPFLYSMMFVQWAPLMCALWFFPWLTPLVLCKPQSAIPILLTRMPSMGPILATLAILAISLAIVPSWPMTWLEQVRSFQGTMPPAFTLPLGPLILLAGLRWRDRRARLILFMGLFPQRMIYDQLALLLVARSQRDLVILLVCSWATFPALWFTSGGMSNLPGGWRIWVVAAHYLPALAVLFFGSPRGDEDTKPSVTAV